MQEIAEDGGGVFGEHRGVALDPHGRDFEAPREARERLCARNRMAHRHEEAAIVEVVVGEQFPVRHDGRSGHACGLDFTAASHLAARPEFAWQKPFLKDMKSQPWTVFEAAK
jgi:hypothetical protein